MIGRDGANTSIWQGNIDPYIPVNSAAANKVYDVAIVGGGITGISTALLLQKAGKQCILFEAENICFGTTGGTTAHLNTLLDTPYSTISNNFGEKFSLLVAEAVTSAIQLIKDNINAYSIDCGFEDANAFLFSETQEQAKELQSLYESSAHVGLKIGYTNRIPVPLPFDKALKLEGQAQFNPVQYVYALAKAFEAAGGIIVQQCRVTNAEGDDILDIETSNGNHQARNIVYATHIPVGVNLLHLRCIPYRSYAMAIRLKDGAYPEGLCYDLQDPYHYYRTQIVNGQSYLIAGGGDHRTGEESNTEKCFLELEAYFRKYFDVEAIAYKWSSQYYEPVDGLPYIGHLPGHPTNMYVATGFGGNGMVYSSIAAQVLKNLIMEEESKYVNLFNPNRIKPVAGFVNFIKHNATVVKDLINGCSPEKIKELSALATDEAKVVKYEDHKLALYKDENNNLHALNSKCTHLGCCVSWNNSEKSWDCPCHGARFDCDGKILNGPASMELEKVSLLSLTKDG